MFCSRLALVLLFALPAAAPAREEETPVEKLLASWAMPGAPKSKGTERHSAKHPNPTSQSYTVKQPFARVWAFYAAKVGEKKKYEPGLNYRSGGGTKGLRYLMSLTQNAAVPERAYCRFAVHGDTFWLVLEISSRDTKKAETRVDVVAGAR